MTDCERIARGFEPVDDHNFAHHFGCTDCAVASLLKELLAAQQALAVCDACCQARIRDVAEARAVARDLAARVREYRTHPGLTDLRKELLVAEAECPWLAEEGG